MKRRFKFDYFISIAPRSFVFSLVSWDDLSQVDMNLEPGTSISF